MVNRSRRRPYRAVQLEKVNTARVNEAIKGKKVVVVGIDVGKSVPMAAVMNEDAEVLATVKWKQPGQTLRFVEWLKELEVERLEVAMEPSGTYGDALRWQLGLAGVAVYRVGTKRSHDAHEGYDGVPSSHDGKSAAVVASVHLQKKSHPWDEESQLRRELKASVRLLGHHAKQMRQGVGKLEGLTARHWPELGEILDSESASYAALLRSFGTPQAVAREPKKGERVLRQASRGSLGVEKIEAVLSSAATSTGVPAYEQERKLIQEVAADVEERRRQCKRAEQEVGHLSAKSPEVAALAEVVGRVTAAVLVSELGPASNYGSAGQYGKSIGLNLVEQRSGKSVKRGLHISKRGSSVARQYLFLATLRLLQKCKVARAWYDKKLCRDGGHNASRLKAVVALMRKLVRGLWHVGQGKAYEPSRLFDVTRLELKP